MDYDISKINSYNSNKTFLYSFAMALEHISVLCVKSHITTVELRWCIIFLQVLAVLFCNILEVGHASRDECILRLFGAKQLSNAMLSYCQLDHQKQTSVNL